MTTETTKQLEVRPAPLEPALPGIPRPALHHVQLKTKQTDEMIAWYGTAVGLVTAFRGPTGAWLTNDDANHRLALLTSENLQEDPDKVVHVGMHHTAWEFGDIGELLDNYARLRDEGILPHRTVNHGQSTSFYYLDPDGNSVELQADNHGDWTVSAEFLRTPEFAADPYGPGVDPEQMLAARDAGASNAELHERSYAGEWPNVRENDRRFPV